VCGDFGGGAKRPQRFRGRCDHRVVFKRGGRFDGGGDDGPASTRGRSRRRATVHATHWSTDCRRGKCYEGMRPIDFCGSRCLIAIICNSLDSVILPRISRINSGCLLKIIPSCGSGGHRVAVQLANPRPWRLPSPRSTYWAELP
jgi:hypothetical protein